MTAPAVGLERLDHNGDREVLVGTVLTLPGVAVAELAAEPFDLVWVDLEHGALDRTQAQELIVGAQAAGALALARIGAPSLVSLTGAMLDAGADGIVAADVRDAHQAARLVALTAYPPVGSRGYGPRRALLRGRTAGEARYRRAPRLWVQIESEEGVAASAEIASIPGIEMLVVGVADLCYALGIPIGLGDARLHDALMRVRDATLASGVGFGLAGPLRPADDLGSLLGDATVLVHSTEARLFAGAVDTAADWLRSAHRDACLASSCSQETGAGG